MPAELPWNVAGVSAETREAARAAARREGLSIGEWLERRLAASFDPIQPIAQPPAPTPVPPTAPLVDAPPPTHGRDDHLSALIAQTETRLTEGLLALEHRQDSAEAAAAQAFGTLNANVSKALGHVREQGQVVDRLVAQFMDLTQKLETLPQVRTPPTLGTETGGVDVLAQEIAALRRETLMRTQTLNDGMTALDKTIEKLRDDCAAAFDALEMRLSVPPAIVSEAADAPPATTRHVSYVPGADAYPYEVDEPPPPFLPEAEPPPSPNATAKPMREEMGIQAADIGGKGEEPDDPPRRNRPMAPVLLILVACLVAAAGLYFSRQPGLTPWSHAPTTSTAEATAEPRPPLPEQAKTEPGTGNAKPTAPNAQTSQSAPPRGEGVPMQIAMGEPPDPQARLQTLAEHGNARAALVLGLGLLARGNDAQGLVRIKQAAQAGEPLAQFRLGDLYERGRGVASDQAHAATLFQAAAEGGNVQAMARIAAAYAAGTGVKRDYAQAARWFTKAAHFGLRDPQFNLAVLYEQGRGVPQSLSQAYTWYAVAAASGDAESRARLAVLAARIPAEDVRAAKAAADAFAPQTPPAAANTAPKAVDVLK